MSTISCGGVGRYAGVSSRLPRRVLDMLKAPTCCRGLSVSHPVDGVHEFRHVGLGDSSPAFDGPVEGAADEFAAGFGRDGVCVHLFDECRVLVGSDWLVGGFVLLAGVVSVVVLVGEDAEDGGEAVAACVGDGASDLLRVSGDEERVFADCRLVGVVEDDGFDGAEGLASVSGVVEGYFLGECESVFFEDWFDVLEECGEVEVFVGAVSGVGGFVGAEVRDFVEDFGEFLVEVVVFHCRVLFSGCVGVSACRLGRRWSLAWFR